MADRNELVQEKANLTGQLKEIIDDYNIKATELLKDLNATTQASLDPLNSRIKEINDELLQQLDQEAGVADA
jgi:ElaB/YqjD/DUF883 family membrane-anchored ribosome-binding protein